jgi:hypothetical protein
LSFPATAATSGGLTATGMAPLARTGTLLCSGYASSQLTVGALSDAVSNEHVWRPLCRGADRAVMLFLVRLLKARLASRAAVWAHEHPPCAGCSGTRVRGDVGDGNHQDGPLCQVLLPLAPGLRCRALVNLAEGRVPACRFFCHCKSHVSSLPSHTSLCLVTYFCG